MKTISWEMPIPERARRIAKLASFDEYVLVHEEKRTPNYGRADAPDNGSIRIWYDPVERIFYREVTFNNKPSTWDVAPLPVLAADPEQED